MARFQQLRWVPMFIKAYYEAQRLTSNPTESIESSESNTAKGVVANAALSKSSGSKALSNRRNSSLRRQNAPRSAKQTGPKNNAVTMMQEARRELRMVNRKLRSLEDIQQQLKGLGISVEELSTRLGDIKSSSVAPPVAPSQSPMPVPPYGRDRGPLRPDGYLASPVQRQTEPRAEVAHV